LLDPLTRLAELQTDFQSKPLGFRLTKPSQLLFHAGHAAVKSSSYQPGKSFHDALINLDTDDEYSLELAELLLATGFGLYSGVLAQEISANAKLIKSPYDKNFFTTIVERPTPDSSKRSCPLSEFFDKYPMLLFAIEAGLALVIFVFIVVWTMSGRRKDK
jgi:hypothetical protein